MGNVIQGVVIDGGATANTIGGTIAAAANVIAGNSTASTSQHYYTNLDIQDAGTSNNLVEGNFIGTNARNAAGLDAAYTFGAFIGYGATDNVIGGTTPGARNIISANTAYGAVIYASGTAGNLIAGNYIGTNKSGSAALGNALDGVIIYGGASANTIGGSAVGAGNLISGNAEFGLLIYDLANQNVVSGNFIGTNAGAPARLQTWTAASRSMMPIATPLAARLPAPATLSRAMASAAAHRPKQCQSRGRQPHWHQCRGHCRVGQQRAWHPH